MFNLIRMNLYSMVRARAFIVMVIVTVVVSVFNVAMLNMDLDYAVENGQQQTEAEDIDIDADEKGAGFTVTYEDEPVADAGVSLSIDDSWVNSDIHLLNLTEMIFSSGIFLILVSVFIALYTNMEQSNGYIKNIAGQLPMRGLLSVSKLMGIAVELLIMMALFTAATVISGKIYFGDKLVIDSIGTLLKYLGINYFLNLAFAAFIQMICTIARGAGIGMTIGIFCCSGIAQMIYSGISYLLSKIGLENVNIHKYTIEAQVMSVVSSSDSETLSRGVIVGAAYLIVCTAVSIFMLQKRDVK